MFEHIIESWFAGCRKVSNAFLQALTADDIKAINTYMNKVALQTFSYFDTGKNPSGEEPERFYHGFVRRFQIPEDCIRKYGFAFCGKKVLIGKA